MILVAVWVGSSFNYYLINFALKYSLGDIYLNTFVSATSELPATLVAGLLYHHMGIRFTLVFLFTLAIVGSLALTIIRVDNV